MGIDSPLRLIRGYLTRAPLIVISLALTGCGHNSYSKSDLPEDYCEREHRRVTDAERIANAVQLAFEKRNATDYHSDLIEKFEGDNAINSKNIRSKSLEFIKQYPDCCIIEDPAFLREKWNKSILEGFNIKHGGWIVDVNIKKRAITNNNLRDYLEFSSDVCGNIKPLWRG